MTPGARAVVAALQRVLAAENSAVYGYGVAGAHLTGARRAAAVRDWAGHENARDALTAMLTARGARPVAAAAGYELPFAVHGPAAAVALAAVLEDRLSAAYLGLVALSDPALREFGARGVRTAALRAAAWRGSTLAFPGLSMPASGAPVPARGGGSPGPSGTAGSQATTHPG